MMYRSTPHSTTGVALQNCCLEDATTNYTTSKISALKKIVTVRGKRKGRFMQTAKGMHVKARFKKVIRCYLDRRKKANCQRHANSLPLQLFRRMQ